MRRPGNGVDWRHEARGGTITAGVQRQAAGVLSVIRIYHHCGGTLMSILFQPIREETMRLPKSPVAVSLLVLCVTAGAADRKYIVKPRSSERKALPFSEGVLVGNTLYIAGHIGLDAKTDMPPASPEEEARLAMDEIKQTVESAGLSMDDVVSIQIFCTDLKLYDTFNNVYKTYFHGHYPARAFLGAANLLRGGRYEVMGIAVQQSR